MFAEFHERRKKFALKLEDLVMPDVVSGLDDRPLTVTFAFVDNLILKENNLFSDRVVYEKHVKKLNRLNEMKLGGDRSAIERCAQMRKCLLSASGKNIQHNIDTISMIHVSIDQQHQETQSYLSVKRSMKSAAMAAVTSESSATATSASTATESDNDRCEKKKNPYLIVPDVCIEWNFFDDNGRVRTKLKNTTLHETTNNLYWIRVAIDDAFLERIFHDLYYRQKNNPSLRLYHHYVFNDVKRCDNGSTQSIVEFYFLQAKADVQTQLRYFEDNVPKEKRQIYFHSACRSFLDAVCPRWYVCMSNVIKFYYFHSNSNNYYRTQFEPQCGSDVDSLRNWFFFGLAFLSKINLTTNTDNLSTPLSGLAFSKPKETGIIKSKQTIMENYFFDDPRVDELDRKQWMEEASRFNNRDVFSDETRSRYPIYTDDNIRDAKMLGLPAPIGACSRNEIVFHVESVDYEQQQQEQL